MIAIRSIGLAAGLMLGVGCMHIQPVGPMAATLGVEEPPLRSPEGALIIEKETAVVSVPELVPAPPPPAPAFLVTPEEIDASNSDEMIQRLKKELETDRNAIDKFPNYSIVSRLPGRH